MTQETTIETDNFLSSHDRQLRIENWGEENQRKIYHTKALVVGSGILGQMVLGCLSGLGVGSIVMMSGERYYPGEQNFMFPSLPYRGIKKIDRIVSTASAINPSIKVRGVHSRFSRSLLDYMGFSPDIIIETENDPSSKEQVADYAGKSKPVISAYVSPFSAEVTIYKGERLEDLLEAKTFSGELPTALPSGVAAGIMADELRKSRFSLLDSDEPLRRKLIYNLESDSRTSPESDMRFNPYKIYDTRVLVAGAGAIGNYVALNLALSGFINIDILDDDSIEDHNLSRQILLYGEIGRSKAEVLSERLREFSRVRSRALVTRLTQDSQGLFREGNYDLVFGCFDNQEARMNLSRLALEFRVPYIDGGTSPSRGSVSVYAPSMTACVECKKDLKPVARRNSCAEALPSVVMPNIVTGSMMVGEAISLLNGYPLDKRLVFDSFEEERIFLSEENPSKGSCACAGGYKNDN